MKINHARVPFAPEEAGYSSERLDVLDRFYSRLIEKEELQCVMYGMARNGKIFVHKAMGKRRFDDEAPDTLQPDSIRSIASITKLFTAVAIMKLVEDGEIQLSTPVDWFLSEFKCGDFWKITIKHLLTHSSGLGGDLGAHGERYNLSPWDLICMEKPLYENWIQATMAGRLHAQPGTEWSYSTICFSLLGEVISRLTGVHCEKWIMDNIVMPLGMNDTYFDIPKEKWDRVVAVNDWSDPYQQEKRKAEDHRSDNFRPPSTGGGMSSTVKDLLIFGQMLLNNGTYNDKRILSRKSVEKLHSDCGLDLVDYSWGRQGTPHPYGYGGELYGVFREGINSRATYGHEGSGYCGLYIDPDENYVTAYFVPNQEGWHEKAVMNGSNIMWSGLR